MDFRPAIVQPGRPRTAAGIWCSVPVVDLTAADFASSFSQSQFRHRALALRPDLHRACGDADLRERTSPREVLECTGSSHVACACQDSFAAGSPRVALGAGCFFSHFESRSASTDAGWARRAAALASSPAPRRPGTPRRRRGLAPPSRPRASARSSRWLHERFRFSISLRTDLRRRPPASAPLRDAKDYEELISIGREHAPSTSPICLGRSADTGGSHGSHSDFGPGPGRSTAPRESATCCQPSPSASSIASLEARGPRSPRRCRGQPGLQSEAARSIAMILGSWWTRLDTLGARTWPARAKASPMIARGSGDQQWDRRHSDASSSDELRPSATLPSWSRRQTLANMPADAPGHAAVTFAAPGAALSDDAGPRGLQCTLRRRSHHSCRPTGHCHCRRQRCLVAGGLADIPREVSIARIGGATHNVWGRRS